MGRRSHGRARYEDMEVKEMDIKTLRELCEKAADTELAAARTALLELLDEVERLRKEVRLLNENINAIKWSIVDTVGGVSYDGEPTSTLNYLQRLRILVEKEKALSLACSQLADVMEVCPAELEWCESRECPDNRGKCWEDYFLEKVRGE
jgi:hypothetical protein